MGEFMSAFVSAFKGCVQRVRSRGAFKGCVQSARSNTEHN